MTDGVTVGTDVATRSPNAEMSVSVAKSYVGEYAPGMLQDCVQLHGGIGVTWEHDLHLYLKRSWALARSWGDRRFHAERVGAALAAALPGPAPDDRGGED